MLKSSKISFSHCRIATIILVLVGFTVFTFASIGGGKNKSRNSFVKEEYKPIRTSQGFTLKSGAQYRGSMIVREVKTSSHVTYNSLVTFQKGNTTYILPNKYKLSIAPSSNHSNLQMLNLKIRICK
jgi:hypothetical protein